MDIDKRVGLYKGIFKRSGAVKLVKNFLNMNYTDRWDKLEAIRKLDTKLSNLYKVKVPVVTCWVRDNSFVPETSEIYLTEPDLEGFLHQFRHYLQNIERRDKEMQGITVEGKKEYYGLPYDDCIYSLYGEDDAIAWSRAIIELAKGI